jgi:hypothetical protein
MATLVNRRMFWVQGGQVTPCTVVAHDLATAMCDIMVGTCRYRVSAYDLHLQRPQP